MAHLHWAGIATRDIDVLAKFSIRSAVLRCLTVSLTLGLSGARAEAQVVPSAVLSDEEAKPVKVRPIARPAAPKVTATLAGKLAQLPFEHSAFPYNDIIPETGGTHFLDNDERGAFHLSPRGGKLYEKVTYADRTSLLYVPKRFALSKPNPTIVLFLHGNLATLQHDVVERQHVPQQLEASGMNAVLVAPQLAVNALDSSAGHFWDADFLDKYIGEAAINLARLSKGASAQALSELPVVIVAYSGGYLATAFSLKYDRQKTQPRIKGVILLDALFGEEPKFADWIEEARQTAFFVSAYSDASKTLNAQLIKTLEDKQIALVRRIPPAIRPGDIVFQAAPAAVHNDFVTQAWAKAPLQDLFRRIDLGASRPLP